jgi:hypothetical protein
MKKGVGGECPVGRRRDRRINDLEGTEGRELKLCKLPENR